ncbi:PREDICTED: IgGFc-binding protein-like [Branchiostoma belcheri]|uniref:IgGFc-binding protein-like n=1 Tax=Branchiostoma belcheri TaxID=7741 RepID=A0A6P4XJY4_BRABE|nr:PREDICTED: IgGFc-binding protein-like [Branchiostoma belcheri]
MACMFLSVLVLALIDCSLAALDNKGTEFILTFPENLQRQHHDPRLFFSCPHPSGADVTVTLPSSGHRERVRVRHGQVKKVELDRVEVELRGSQKSDDYKAVHITSDVEIVVYGVFAEHASSDAYLALPTDGLGTEYFVSCSSIVQFGVAGVHDETTVTIVPSQAVTFDGQNYAAGQKFSVRLDRFETLQVQTAEDLTGSKITATHPVAVLSGNVFAICRPMDERQTGSGDFIVEMIPPVDTWGKEFVTVPLAMHTGGDLFRVVAARDNTQVDVTNENTMTLNAGEFWEIDVPSDEYRHVTSSEPVLLVQYSKTGNSDGTDTDPFMVIIPPVAQFQSEYTFATVELVVTGPGSTHHINLVVSIINITPSYGFVKPESYGYPGGLRLARIAASCSATTPVPGDRQDNDCDGRVDEELLNGRDDDGDGLVDEDLAVSNCADHRDRYRECLVQRCRNLAP